MDVPSDLIAVSVEEAGRMLGYKRAAAYKLFSSGEIPGLIRVGKSNRVSVDTLRTWVERRAKAHGRRKRVPV